MSKITQEPQTQTAKSEKPQFYRKKLFQLLRPLYYTFTQTFNNRHTQINSSSKIPVLGHRFRGSGFQTTEVCHWTDPDPEVAWKRGLGLTDGTFRLSCRGEREWEEKRRRRKAKGLFASATVVMTSTALSNASCHNINPNT